MASFRTKALGLLNQVVTSFDNTKTYITGHITQKTINSVNVLGAGLTQIFDTFTETAGIFAVAGIFQSPNGRQFEISTSSAAGVVTIALYNFNTSTGVKGSLIGRIQLNLPSAAATTHTIRGFHVKDSGTTGWTIGLATTGTVLINAGVFTVWNVDLADFTTTPTVFGMGIASGTKSVYFQQDPSALGVSHVMTAISGGAMSNIDSKFYISNGLLAAMSFYGFDMSVTPTIVSQVTTSPTVNGTPTFTLTGHGYVANDQVVLTANVPSAFTATTSTVQTVYFVRNPTANTFELSATSGGASINATSNTASTTVMRAFGITTAGFIAGKKSAVFNGATSGFTGTILLTNSHDVVTPAAGHPLAGFECFFLSTTTNFHMFKLSDITAGGSSFPSMSQINITGTGTDITAPTAAYATYSETTGNVIYTTTTCSLITKAWVNSAIIKQWGGQQITWYENSGLQTTGIGFTSMNGIHEKDGWLFISGATAGQRVVIAQDVYSTSTLGNSYIITPVMQTTGWTLRSVETFEQLPELTASSVKQYKTAATSNDAGFSNTITGWTTIPNNIDESAITLNNYTKFKILPNIIEYLPNSPAQISEVIVGYSTNYDNSENWVSDEELSTKSTDNPAYSVAMLSLSYQTSVPKITFYAISKDTGLIVRQKDTTNNPTEFKYSTNDGGTWNALGTVPNTQYTRLRYEWGVSLPEDVYTVWSDA